MNVENVENDLVKVALASEIPPRSMKHVDIGGKEIALVNIDGSSMQLKSVVDI